MISSASAPASAIAPHTLVARGVRKRLGGRLVLDDVALAIAGAETRALLGKNGAGKSTLLRVIAGVIAPDAGELLLDGLPLDGAARAARRHLGYVPESADPLPHLTVAELLALVTSLRQAAQPDGALVERLGVTPLLAQRIGTLSLGQRRRACLSAALVGEPWLLVLDEPTNGLDPAGVTELAELLVERRARGGATLVATHDLAFADAVAGTRWRLDGGKLVDDQAA